MFFHSFLPHLTLVALLYINPDLTTALNPNYLKFTLPLATFVNSSNRLILTKLSLVFQVSYCKHVLMKFHLRYADYLICPQSLGHFLKNGKMQILSLFINVSQRQWFKTIVEFCFLMFYLKLWKDKFITRFLVLFALILSTGSMVSCQENPLCLNYLKLLINSLLILRGDHNLMLFI